MSSSRKIGLVSSVAFAVGTMIGAGVFVLSGVAIKDAGPAALVAFGLAGAAILCSALSFTVIASLARRGESGYVPVGKALGHPIFGLLTSWAFYLAAIFGAAFVLHAFGTYLQEFFVSSAHPIAVGVAAALGLAVINLGPIDEIGKVESVLVIAKLLILAAFVGAGLLALQGSDLTPFVPHGADSILSTTAILFIAYLGFSAITNISGDIDRPRKTVPRAILISMLIVALIYAGVVLTLLSADLSTYTESSVGGAAKQLLGPIGGVLVPLAALFATLSAANANILSTSEIAVRLAARKEAPTFVGRLWRGHPLISVGFAVTAVVGLLLVNRPNTVIVFANVAPVYAMLLINLAVIRAQLKRTPGAIRLPLGPVLPAIGFLSCVGELYVLGAGPAAIGGGLVLAGGTFYLLRRRLHRPEHHRSIVALLESGLSPIVRMLGR